MLSYIKDVWRGYPSPSKRMKERTSDFQLISLRPYYNTQTCSIDFNLPLRTNPYLTTSENVPEARWIKKNILCADDICVSAFNFGIEPRALGIDKSLRDTILEVARNPDAEKARYIVINHHLVRKRNLPDSTDNAIVFINDSVPKECKQTLVVPLALYQ